MSLYSYIYIYIYIHTYIIKYQRPSESILTPTLILRLVANADEHRNPDTCAKTETNADTNTSTGTNTNAKTNTIQYIAYQTRTVHSS